MRKCRNSECRNSTKRELKYLKNIYECEEKY